MILISGTMLFATLLMGYSLYRSTASMWPPAGSSRVDLGYPILSTLTILISSWFCRQVKMGVKAGNLKDARMNLHTTLVLGLIFMGIQILFWTKLQASGVVTSSGIFASIIYGYTWIHALHVLMGLGSLVWLRLVLKETTTNLWQKTLNVEKFWHFLGIIWLIMFLTLFVL